MDITNARLNWPGGQFSANKEMKYPKKNLKGKKNKDYTQFVECEKLII